MLQNLFSLKLFCMYLLVSFGFVSILIFLYTLTLKRVEKAKNFYVFVISGLLLYALVIGYIIYTMIVYGCMTSITTLFGLGCVLYYPMRKLTSKIEEKGVEIVYFNKNNK